MAQGIRIGSMLAALGLAVTGAASLAGGGDGAAKPGPRPAQAAKPPAPAARPGPSLAEQFERIRAEYRARQEALSQALEKVKDRREQNALYRTMSPDEVAFSRRMVELAASSPADPAARDALVWVLNKPGMSDRGPYGDEFARAAALLVRHHGDDPEAIRVGLGLSNVLSDHRDALLRGFAASAKGREAKGLACLALAEYLERKAVFSEGARKIPGRRKIRLAGFVGDDGKVFDKDIDQTDEEYAYDLHLRQCDPEVLRAEAERLYREVIADYADIPLITVKTRELEALLKQPSPEWNGKPLTQAELQRLREIVSRKKTLGQSAEARLDEMLNLAVGKLAPEIDGVDLDGKPCKLSDYRGKVVALVFWGTWCGPCMREVPHERELVERLKGRPFAMLGVNCDGDKQAALKVMKAEGITWRNWNDGDPGTGPIVNKYHVQGYPTVFVIDAQGIIRSTNSIGSALDQSVNQLLEEMEAKAAPR